MSSAVDGPAGSSAGRGSAGAPGGLPDAPACPFCEGRETDLVNPFGSHASVATYWCRSCRSPFEILKWRGGRERGGTPPGDGPS